VLTMSLWPHLFRCCTGERFGAENNSWLSSNVLSVLFDFSFLIHPFETSSRQVNVTSVEILTESISRLLRERPIVSYRTIGVYTYLRCIRAYNSYDWTMLRRLFCRMPTPELVIESSVNGCGLDFSVYVRYALRVFVLDLC